MYLLLGPNTSAGNDPNTIDKDPGNSFPRVDVRREVGERQKEEEVQWQAVGGQRGTV